VVDRPAPGSVRDAAARVLNGGDHLHQVDFLARPLGPEIALRRRLQLGREGGGVRAEVEDLRPRPLLRLPHLHRLARQDRGDRRGRVVEIAWDDPPPPPPPDPPPPPPPLPPL